jgi:hypothetical protein
LPAPVTLEANQTYDLVSSETAGGDLWYDWNQTVTSTGGLSVISTVWSYPGGPYIAARVAASARVWWISRVCPGVPLGKMAAVDAYRGIREFWIVSTLLRIESEVAGLPARDQKILLAWLQGRLATMPEPAGEIPETLRIFRELQKEIGLTEKAAAAWKSAVQDGRR